MAVPEGHDFTMMPADAEYATGELLIRFSPKTSGEQLSTAEKKQILSSFCEATIKRNYTIVPGLSLVKLPIGTTVKDSLTVYNNASGILYAEPNYKIYMASTFPNDPCLSKQWALHNTGQSGGTEDADIDAPEAWDIATDASDIIVAVTDTGIDFGHPDLIGNFWENEVEKNGIPNYDDDGNGYIDDIRGWDFVNDDNYPIDDCFHGTHVAGIIGGVGNNNTGVAGVCWQAKIMNLKFLNENGGGTIANASFAIQYAVDKGAQIINASWGFSASSSSLEDAIDAADACSVLVVACAHNWDANLDVEITCYPASYELNNIIAVMSTDQNDVKSDFSNWGPITVDLGAPGGWGNPFTFPSYFNDDDIYSTMPRSTQSYMKKYLMLTYYDYAAGTSMATPYVAGAAALVWAEKPGLTHLEVKDILLDTVDKLDALEDLCVTEGRLNLHKALHRTFLYPGAGGELCIKSDSGKPVARFDDSGNLYLKGTLNELSYPEASEEDEFRFQDMYGTENMIIDANTGNVYLRGYLYEEEEEPLTPPTYLSNLIFKNSSGNIVSYVDYGGHLHLKGNVYEGQ
jgi:subtilisin family serine protease